MFLKCARVEGQLRDKDNPDKIFSDYSSVVGAYFAKPGEDDITLVKRAKEKAIAIGKILEPDKVFVLHSASVGERYVEHYVKDGE